MKYFMSIIGTFLCVITLTAQSPAAQESFANIQSLLEGKDGLEVKFEIQIDLPGGDKDLIAGNIWQHGDNLHLETEDVEVICDGQTVWTYLKFDEVIQITDFEDNGGGILSPSSILKEIEGANFQYDILGVEAYDGQQVRNLEFKPVDRNSEYSKARIRLMEKEDIPVTFELFEKTGTRYALRIVELRQQAIAANHFVFNKEKYPNVDIEDLRL